jgi:hypothetical protein
MNEFTMDNELSDLLFHVGPANGSGGTGRGREIVFGVGILLLTGLL